MLILISVQIFRLSKTPFFFLYIHSYSYISPNLPLVQTPSFFSLISCLFSYQSKSSVHSNPLFFFFKFMLILISVQTFRLSKTPSFFSLNSCLFLYLSKSSVCSKIQEIQDVKKLRRF